MKKKTLLLWFAGFLVLSGCHPYPGCPVGTTCTTLSTQESFLIPFILPLTSPNAVQVEEQKQAIQSAMLDRPSPDSAFRIEFYDNYDLAITNQQLLGNFLEDPDKPLIVTSWSSNLANPSPADEFGNPVNTIYTLPGSHFYIQHAFDSLVNDLPTALPILLLTTYPQLDMVETTAFCAETRIECLPFDSILLDEGVRERFNHAPVIILAAQLDSIQDWLQQFSLSPQQTLILMDTAFSKPSLLPEIPATADWYLPEFWFEIENANPRHSWNYATSYWTYQISQQLFDTLSSHTVRTNSGFHQVINSQLQTHIPQTIRQPQISFQRYQFKNSQYIIRSN